jgi:hypothetical protein
LELNLFEQQTVIYFCLLFLSFFNCFLIYEDVQYFIKIQFLTILHVVAPGHDNLCDFSPKNKNLKYKSIFLAKL